MSFVDFFILFILFFRFMGGGGWKESARCTIRWYQMHLNFHYMRRQLHCITFLGSRVILRGLFHSTVTYASTVMQRLCTNCEICNTERKMIILTRKFAGRSCRSVFYDSICVLKFIRRNCCGIRVQWPIRKNDGESVFPAFWWRSCKKSRTRICVLQEDVACCNVL